MKIVFIGGLLVLTILLSDVTCKPAKKIICYCKYATHSGYQSNIKKSKAKFHLVITISLVTNWSVHRPGEGKFVPENIDPDLCTHIVYAYSVLDPETLTIKSSNPSIDIDAGFYKRVTDLRQKGVKVLIAIGGSASSVGDKYDRLLTDANASRRFIASVMSFIHEHNFDGLDIEVSQFL